MFPNSEKLGSSMLDLDLNTYGLPAYHPIAWQLKAVLTTEFGSKEDAITSVATIDDLMSSMESPRRISAWRLLCLTQCDGIPYGALLDGLKRHPDAVSPALATALCLQIDDPNHEDCIKQLLARVPVFVLDHQSVARACLFAFNGHRRHIDVALSVFGRLSVSTLYLVSDEIVTHINSLASNKKLLRRVEKLVIKIEAPGGEAYEQRAKRYFNA